MRPAGRLALVVMCLVLGGAVTHGQLRKQAREGAPVQALTAAERATLGDPLFNLVLKATPTETTLDGIERRLMGATGTRRLFVVHEQGLDPTRGGSRRSVLTYRGTTQGQQLQPNVVLSISFTDQALLADDIEAWGWDDAHSRYNYYKLDRQPGEASPSWKFRGTSVGADALSPAARAGTCMRCHVNGAPVMKELPLPWNNWHSFKSTLDYLDGVGADDWPIAATPRFRTLTGAESLEVDVIVPSVKQFNGRRVKALVRALPGGAGSEVTDGKRLLKPLFVSTEYNLNSAPQTSGLHPFPAVGTGPAEAVAVPDTFFLNANLLAGGGLLQYRGVNVPDARQFGSVLAVTAAEYRQLVEDFHTTIGGARFDTQFAWFTPEASHVDNHLVDVLVREGIVTPEFAASVLAVDLETPVFSAPRASLLRFVPATFRFKPRGPDDVPTAHPDAMTRSVIQAIRAAGTPAPGSPEATWLALLEDPDPLEKVRGLVRDYLQRERTALGGAGRAGELKRLYTLLLDRREKAVAAVPDIVESTFLFPIGSGH
jgi:hypothetical protein